MTGESLQEIVARETVADDPEQDATEPDAEPDAEPDEDADREPEDTLPLDAGLDFEAQRKKLDRESTRHENRVREIMGEDADILEVCPLCQVPGFVFPFTEADPSAEPRRDAVMAYFGGDEPLLQPDPTKTMCETCGGWGEVLSGSKHPNTRRVPCTPCAGMGWIATSTPAQPPTYVPVPGEVPMPPPGNGATTQPADVWDRPFGHPHYGIPPALVSG